KHRRVRSGYLTVPVVQHPIYLGVCRVEVQWRKTFDNPGTLAHQLAVNKVRAMRAAHQLGAPRSCDLSAKRQRPKVDELYVMPLQNRVHLFAVYELASEPCLRFAMKP